MNQVLLGNHLYSLGADNVDPAGRDYIHFTYSGKLYEVKCSDVDSLDTMDGIINVSEDITISKENKASLSGLDAFNRSFRRAFGNGETHEW